jgi:hypothetical protein
VPADQCARCSQAWFVRKLGKVRTVTLLLHTLRDLAGPLCAPAASGGAQVVEKYPDSVSGPTGHAGPRDTSRLAQAAR